MIVTRWIELPAQFVFFSPGNPQREEGKKQKNLHLVSFPFHTTPYNSLMALGPHVSTPGSRILLTGARAELTRRPRKDGHQRRNFFFSFPFSSSFVVAEKENRGTHTKKKGIAADILLASPPISCIGLYLNL